MPIVDIDVTTAGLIPDGDYVCNVNGLKYQVSHTKKTDGTDKNSWKKDDYSDVDFDSWSKADVSAKRLHYTLGVPGHGNLFHDLYMMESARGFIKQFMVACGVAPTKAGFDPESVIGKQIGVKVGIDSSQENESNKILKMWKV